MKTPHTSTYRGKRVYVRMKTGERFVAKFIERKGRFIVFDSRMVDSGDVKAFAIYREKNSIARY